MMKVEEKKMNTVNDIKNAIANRKTMIRMSQDALKAQRADLKKLRDQLKTERNLAKIVREDAKKLREEKRAARDAERLTKKNLRAMKREEAIAKSLARIAKLSKKKKNGPAKVYTREEIAALAVALGLEVAA